MLTISSEMAIFKSIKNTKNITLPLQHWQHITGIILHDLRKILLDFETNIQSLNQIKVLYLNLLVQSLDHAAFIKNLGTYKKRVARISQIKNVKKKAGKKKH